MAVTAKFASAATICLAELSLKNLVGFSLEVVHLNLSHSIFHGFQLELFGFGLE